MNQKTATFKAGQAFLPQAGGLKDFSRWLRARQRPTPPEFIMIKQRTPEGCQTTLPASGIPPGCVVSFIFHRWYRSPRDLNHRLSPGKPPACSSPLCLRLTLTLLAILALALATLPAPRAAAASKLTLPPWLAEATTRSAPPDKDATVETLHDEQIVTVAPSGKMTKTTHEAMRILTRDGRKEATVAIPYDTSSKKITAFKAWLVRPGGDGKTYTTKDTLDVAVVPDKTLYTELRAMILPPVDTAYESCVFAYEYTLEDKGISGQTSWQFQSLWPTALSRITYKLPKGWTITATMRNHAPIDPTTDTATNTHTWEMRDLPPVPKEPLAPSISRIAPFLDINLYPPPATRPPPRISFPDWKSVSINDTALTAKAAEPDPAIAAKTADLLAAAGANDTLWNRINALARFAQSTNYVSIAMNLGKFGGNIPRPAPEVLKTGYGDCKDKTALLRALLKSAGIDSYAVWAYSGDRYYVNEKWPATGQFNHCITAIKITDPSIKSYTIVDHPELGRLLFFDPTDTVTALGDLDTNTQGSQVLVLAGDHGALLRLPFAAPADNRLNRTIDATLDATGAITVHLDEHSTGQAAATERAAALGPKTKYDDWNRAWINNSVPASKILKTTATDSPDWRTFDLAIEFTAPGYAKMMRDKLLVFNPAIIGRRNSVPLTKPTRAHPVILDPNSFFETAVIEIPAGYTVDELPPPAEATAAFGHYKATTTYDPGKRQVLYHRELERSAAEIPASDYATVRQFYETMRKAEQSNVVLRKE